LAPSSTSTPRPPSPTRRSSDLATGAPEDEIYAKWAEITADDMAIADEYLASAHLPVADSTAIAAAVSDVERPVPDQDLTDIFMTDRKSTRLNSSHVSISYAVVC